MSSSILDLIVSFTIVDLCLRRELEVIWWYARYELLVCLQFKYQS